MARYGVKIMPEYCSTGLWDLSDEGCSTTLTSLVDSTKEVLLLEEDIQEWNDCYDANVFHDKSNPNFDWKGFHERGMALARRVKALLGSDSYVEYWKDVDYPFEDEIKKIVIG